MQQVKKKCRNKGKIRNSQMALVLSGRKNRAQFILLEKRRKRWRIKMQCPAYIGKNGMGKQYEGDGKTPVGLYHLTEAFGRKKNPGTVLAYTRLTPYHYWCTDVKSKAYNRMVKIPFKGKDRNFGEHLYQYKKQYRYALCIDYNKERVPGRGSAIFLHCVGKRKYTEGCVAISSKNIKKLLKCVEGEIPIFFII